LSRSTHSRSTIMPTFSEKVRLVSGLSTSSRNTVAMVRRNHGNAIARPFVSLIASCQMHDLEPGPTCVTSSTSCPIGPKTAFSSSPPHTGKRLSSTATLSGASSKIHSGALLAFVH
jgi:hypothetical protein